MKLEIGSRWRNDFSKFAVEAKVTGLESIDEELSDGEIVLPEGPKSMVEIEKYDNVSGADYESTVQLEIQNAV